MLTQFPVIAAPTVSPIFGDRPTRQPLRQPKALTGNAPHLLDDPHTIWQVRSGAVALFSIQVQQGVPRGKRRYLFTARAGDRLFAAEPSAAIAYQILAVALEPTHLEPQSTAQFYDWLTAEPALGVAQMEAWVYQLSLAMSAQLPRVSPTAIASCGVLCPREIWQPTQGTITWTRILQGQGQLLGSPNLPLTTEAGRLPLTSHLWVQAATIVEIDTCAPTDIPTPAAFLKGVQRVQALVLQGIQHLEQQVSQQELERIQAQEQLNQQVMDQALGNLASVFEPTQNRPRHQREAQPQATNPEEALLVAAGAVGRALGITIAPPAASEDARRVQNPLEAIARASHIRIRRVVLREDWWQKDSGPLLAYRREDDRPVALLPLSAHQYEIFDPLHQHWQRCDHTIAAELAPTAYTFYRPFPQQLTPLQLVKFAVWGHHAELITIVWTGIAATLVGMVTPYATAELINEVIPNANRDLLSQMALGLLATAIGAGLFQITQGFAVMRLEAYADAVTQSAVWDRLLKLQVSFFRQYSVGDLSSRVSAISQIRQKLSTTMLKSLFSSLFSLLNLGLLFYYSIPLALIATFVAGVNIAVTVTAGVMTLRRTRPLLSEQGKLFGLMVQIVKGVAKFRLAGAENRAFAYWGKQYTHQLKLMLGTQSIEDNLTIINKLLSVLTPAMLFMVTAMLLQQSQAAGKPFEIGTFLAFNTAFGTFISGATSLSTIVVDILETLPIWERTQPILQGVPEVDDEKSDPGHLNGQLAVEQARFRYRPEGNLILQDVSIKAEPGEFIALVGPSGSGKSTLLRLLLGFDVPESGSVYYDGQDLAGLDIPAVRRQLGVVLQNSQLMSASIFENIASGALITLDEAWEAARMAGFAEDVADMPMGMHTVVSEGGSNISGGQRQRLMIARALALRPRILFFDEATSALDNRTQAIVSESLDRLKVTRVVVAHRLSTIRNADRIYVLQQGRLVEEGTFDALAQQGGVFAQLVQRQQL